MPKPKRRHSKSRTSKRRTHDALKAVALGPCPQCSELKPPHVVCTNCGHVEHLFGTGGGARMAAQYGVELLGELPLDVRVREEADGGAPTVVAAPDSPHAAPDFIMARRTAAALARRAKASSTLFPKIVVEES